MWNGKHILQKGLVSHASLSWVSEVLKASNQHVSVNQCEEHWINMRDEGVCWRCRQTEEREPDTPETRRNQCQTTLDVWTSSNQNDRHPHPSTSRLVGFQTDSSPCYNQMPHLPFDIRLWVFVSAFSSRQAEKVPLRCAGSWHTMKRDVAKDKCLFKKKVNSSIISQCWEVGRTEQHSWSEHKHVRQTIRVNVV